jgi:hypothetical protein
MEGSFPEFGLASIKANDILDELLTNIDIDDSENQKGATEKLESFDKVSKKSFLKGLKRNEFGGLVKTFLIESTKTLLDLGEKADKPIEVAVEAIENSLENIIPDDDSVVSLPEASFMIADFVDYANSRGLKPILIFDEANRLLISEKIDGS